jgi:hypothetical protein
MRKDRYRNYNRPNHINYIVAMLIAEIPPGDGFGEEVRQVHADVGEVLETHIRLFEQSHPRSVDDEMRSSSQRTLS